MTSASKMPMTLHRARDVWWVGDTVFYLGRGRGGWVIGASNPAANDWLREHGIGLGRADEPPTRFATRREALHVLTSYLAADPPADGPDGDVEPPLVRVGPGRYRTADKQFDVERHDDIWLITPDHGWDDRMTSLWQVRAHIAFLRLRVSQPDADR